VAFSGSADTNVRTTLDLPPGNYEVRMAVEHEKTAAVASVFAAIVVPRFDVAPLSLSDVIIQASVPPSAAAPHEPALGPTTRRVFSPAEQVRAVLEVYQGTRLTAPLSATSVRNRIVDAAGRAVRDQRVELAAKDFVNRKAALSIDMTALPPGAYTLTIEAALDRRSARRSIPFVVR
jgi:hypothetical protein